MDVTKTELKVAGFIASGLSNEEICEKLNIKITTLKTHINNLMKKLHISDAEPGGGHKRVLLALWYLKKEGFLQ